MPVKIQVFKCDLQCVSQRIEYYDLELLRGKKNAKLPEPGQETCAA